MTTYAIGDIHGRADELAHLLYDVIGISAYDTLIPLGDMVDGGLKTFEVLEFFVRCPNKVIPILGNHDEWALEWFNTGYGAHIWYAQGGSATMSSYGMEHTNVPQSHVKFLERAVPYYVDTKQRLFVHGGIIPGVRMEFQERDILLWDRNLIKIAMMRPIQDFRHIFIGHTSTGFYDKTLLPKTFNNLTMLDTGAGWSGGKLTAMDVKTLKFYQVKVFPDRGKDYSLTYQANGS